MKEEYTGAEGNKSKSHMKLFLLKKEKEKKKENNFKYRHSKLFWNCSENDNKIYYTKEEEENKNKLCLYLGSKQLAPKGTGARRTHQEGREQDAPLQWQPLTRWPGQAE